MAANLAGLIAGFAFEMRRHSFVWASRFSEGSVTQRAVPAEL